jgi:hypothetical protein
MTTMDMTPPKPEFDPLAPHKFKLEQHASHTALLKVMAHRNPEHSMEVGRFKLLFASLITEAEEIRDRQYLPEEIKSGVPHVPNVDRNLRLAEAKHNMEVAIDLLDEACLLMTKAVLL